jgi:hypothetical protein
MKYRYYLSLLVPVKYEDDYIVEFIKFYLLQGVEHFYLYDNDNDIPLNKTLENYLDVCTIEVIKGEFAQSAAYKHWLKTYKHETKWIAIFDVDEFVLPKANDTFLAFLKQNEKHDSIAINWKIFGNGKHESKPNGLVTESYLYSEGKQHANYKCVTQTKAIKKLEHPHRPELKAFKKIVNAKGNKIFGFENHEYCLDIIQLNHYYSKSTEEYMKKLNRKRADTGKTRIEHEENHAWIFDEHIRTSVSFDSELWDKYGSELKQMVSST